MEKVNFIRDCIREIDESKLYIVGDAYSDFSFVQDLMGDYAVFLWFVFKHWKRGENLEGQSEYLLDNIVLFLETIKKERR